MVVPHGGPWARDTWGYNALAQFFANRGYAVLMPNFRGSTGYGKKFLNAGNGEWGTQDAGRHDVGRQVPHREGIADPKRVGILGGSYGGYADARRRRVHTRPLPRRRSISSVRRTCITLLDSIPPYWEAVRKMMYARMADPGTPSGKAWLKERVAAQLRRKRSKRR